METIEIGYESPEITVMEILVEHGFQGSGDYVEPTVPTHGNW